MDYRVLEMICQQSNSGTMSNILKFVLPVKMISLYIRKKIKNFKVNFFKFCYNY